MPNCVELNLAFNTKSKKLMTDFRKSGKAPAPICVNGDVVEFASSLKFLGVRRSVMEYRSGIHTYHRSQLATLNCP